MAIGFVGSQPTVGANNGGNVTLTFSNMVDAAGSPVTLQQGHVVIAAYASSGTADAAMSTSSTGWTEFAEHFSNGTLDTNIAVYGKEMGASPDTSITFVGPGGASNGTIGVAIALSGADISALDVSAVLSAGTGTSVPNGGSVTPLTSGAWIVVVGAGTAAAGAAFTNPGDLATTTNHFRSGNHAETNDIAIGMGLKENWASGAFDPAAWGGGNVNASNSWAAIVLVIKPKAEVTLLDVTAVVVDYTEQPVTLNAGTRVPADGVTETYTPQAVTPSNGMVVEVVAAAGAYAPQSVLMNLGILVSAAASTIAVSALTVTLNSATALAMAAQAILVEGRGLFLTESSGGSASSHRRVGLGLDQLGI